MAKLVGPNHNITDLQSKELGWWRGVLHRQCFFRTCAKAPESSATKQGAHLPQVALRTAHVFSACIVWYLNELP